MSSCEWMELILLAWSEVILGGMALEKNPIQKVNKVIKNVRNGLLKNTPIFLVPS